MAVCGGCGGGGCVLGETGGPSLSPATSGSRRWTPDGAGGLERERESTEWVRERMRVSGVASGLRDLTSTPFCSIFPFFLFN